METTIEQVLAAVVHYRFRYADERELQDGLEQAFELAGLGLVREARLSAQERPDFLVGRIAVEVKVKGDMRSLAAQVARYCRLSMVDGVVVVTSRVRHLRLPATIEGKPVAVVELASAGL